MPQDASDGGPDRDRLDRQRHRLLEELDAEVSATAGRLGFDRLPPAVRRALDRVPRHRFAPSAPPQAAYENRPLPIGHGQTISQPYVVAVMTALAEPDARSRVLEIGTGCGYQTALLAELAAAVYSIEAVAELAESARSRLAELGYENIVVRCGDGSRGWPKEAPFDAIVVTAAAPRTAVAPLAAQLSPGGRLVIPLEREGGWRLLAFEREQELTVIHKDVEGRLHERGILPVAFVPLVSRGPAEDPG